MAVQSSSTCGGETAKPGLFLSIQVREIALCLCLVTEKGSVSLPSKLSFVLRQFAASVVRKVSFLLSHMVNKRTMMASFLMGNYPKELG